ncbi:MAG: hypothetical protein ACRDLP_18235 [Solirubrobacteraceae bacterium]
MSTDPADARAWHKTVLAPGAVLSAVSCFGPGRCVAVARNGAVYATAAVASPPVTWSATTIDAAAPLSAVSCSRVGLCVALDQRGSAFETDAPASARPNWWRTAIHLASGANAVSCRAVRFCMAVDSSGMAVAASLPGPTALPGNATVVSQTTALLGASVNPGDTTLLSCDFEYGTVAAGGRRAPCSPAPRATAGDQVVAARIGGLRAGTTYRFRVVVATVAGSTAGGAGEFVTPAPVTAGPSLVGTPAVGSTLSCDAGVRVAAAPSSRTTLAYTWLADTRPIPGATASSYVPTAADAGEHLQCQVSISGDGATTTTSSGFDAIPQQRGRPPIETSIGRVTWHGTHVSVRARCSPQATPVCSFALRLIATTTRWGLRAATTVGAAHAALARGATRTLTVRLNKRGRRMLERRRVLAATLRVEGTILGTLNARLISRRIVLIATPTGAVVAAPHRRAFP